MCNRLSEGSVCWSPESPIEFWPLSLNKKVKTNDYFLFGGGSNGYFLNIIWEGSSILEIAWQFAKMLNILFDN